MDRVTRARIKSNQSRTRLLHALKAISEGFLLLVGDWTVKDSKGHPGRSQRAKECSSVGLKPCGSVAKARRKDERINDESELSVIGGWCFLVLSRTLRLNQKTGAKNGSI